LAFSKITVTLISEPGAHQKCIRQITKLKAKSEWLKAAA
jgi:hypothetical protein